MATATKKSTAKAGKTKVAPSKTGESMDIQDFASVLTLKEGKKNSITRGDALECLKIINKELEPVLGKNGFYNSIKKLSK